MLKTLKIFLPALLITLNCIQVRAQDGSSDTERKKRFATKIILAPGPFSGIFGLQQEVKVGERFSVTSTMRVMFPKKIKEKGSVTYEEKEYNPFNGLKLSAIGNITDFRIYSKDNGALKGFYYGPYFTITAYKLQSTPQYAEFTDDNNITYSADVSHALKMRIMGLGAQIGIQGYIKNKIPIDWTILGFGFGGVKLTGEVKAENTSANFDFRNYDEDVKKATLGLEKYLPFAKNLAPEKISLSVKAPTPIFRMSLSIGIAY